MSHRAYVLSRHWATTQTSQMGLRRSQKTSRPNRHSPEAPQKIVTLRLVGRDKKPFPGDELILSMRGIGLASWQVRDFPSLRWERRVPHDI